jgi:hypothetical protein
LTAYGFKKRIEFTLKLEVELVAVIFDKWAYRFFVSRTTMEKIVIASISLGCAWAVVRFFDLADRTGNAIAPSFSMSGAGAPYLFVYIPTCAVLFTAYVLIAGRPESAERSGFRKRNFTKAKIGQKMAVKRHRKKVGSN